MLSSAGPDPVPRAPEDGLWAVDGGLRGRRRVTSYMMKLRFRGESSFYRTSHTCPKTVFRRVALRRRFGVLKGRLGLVGWSPPGHFHALEACGDGALESVHLPEPLGVDRRSLPESAASPARTTPAALFGQHPRIPSRRTNRRGLVSEKKRPFISPKDGKSVQNPSFPAILDSRDFFLFLLWQPIHHTESRADREWNVSAKYIGSRNQGQWLYCV